MAIPETSWTQRYVPTTNHAAEGSVFVYLRNTGNLKIDLVAGNGAFEIWRYALEGSPTQVPSRVIPTPFLEPLPRFCQLHSSILGDIGLWVGVP